MALVVETGVGVVGANSYADVTFADDYFEGHPFYSDSWSDISTPTKEFLLEAATRDLDTMFNWYGAPATSVQGLRWPRVGAVTVDAVIIPRNSIPVQLRQAVCEQARYLSTTEGNPDAPSDTGGVTELKVDVITLKFDGGSTRKAVPSAAMRLLRGLGAPYGKSFVRKVQVTL